MPNLESFPELSQFSNQKCLVVNNFHGIYDKKTIQQYQYVIYTCFAEVFALNEFNNLINCSPDTQFIILTARKYLRSIQHPRVTIFYLPSCYGFFGEIYKPFPIPYTKQIIKHGLSLNWRSQWNRLALAQFLTQENLLDFFYFSYHNHDRFHEGSRAAFENTWENCGITWFNYKLDKESFYQKIPFITGIDEGFVLDNHNIFTIGNPNYYLDTFFSFVNETYIDENWDCFFTEKIWKPIAYGHPFLIFSSAGACGLLRELGFETFGDIFDESYDSIESPQIRFESLLQEVKKNCLLDHSSLIKLHQHLQPKLLHNQQCLFENLKYRYHNDLQKVLIQIEKILL